MQVDIKKTFFYFLIFLINVLNFVHSVNIFFLIYNVPCRRSLLGGYQITMQEPVTIFETYCRQNEVRGHPLVCCRRRPLPPRPPPRRSPCCCRYSDHSQRRGHQKTCMSAGRVPLRGSRLPVLHFRRCGVRRRLLFTSKINVQL